MWIKKDFSLNSTSSCVFYHSQWEACKAKEHASLKYAIYRFFFMVSLISSITFSNLCDSHLFPIFLTNWSYTLQTLYGILFFVNIVWRKHDFLLRTIRQKDGHKGHKNEEEPIANRLELNVTTNEENSTTDVQVIIVPEDFGTDNVDVANEEQQLHHNSTPATDMTDTTVIVERTINVNINVRYVKNDKPPTALEKLIWILMNITHVDPHLVTFGYWVFVYEYKPGMRLCEIVSSHFLVHAGVSALALIDSLVVAVPVRITHTVFPTLLLVAYTVFSYIYEIVGGEYPAGREDIYSVLNWRYGATGTLYFVTAGILAAVFVHTFTCWGVYHLRLRLVDYFKRSRK